MLISKLLCIVFSYCFLSCISCTHTHHNNVDTVADHEDCSEENSSENTFDQSERRNTLPDITILEEIIHNRDIFTSHDRKTYNLRGNVKKSIIEGMYHYHSDSLEFDKNGKLMVSNGLEVKRNSEGYIISILDIDKEGEDGPHIEGGKTYIYDNEGRVKMYGVFGMDSGSGEFPYVYQGFDTKESYIFAEPDYYTGERMFQFATDGISYDYLKFDSHGNWILRNVRIEEFEGEPNIREYRESRRIEYY